MKSHVARELAVGSCVLALLGGIVFTLETCDPPPRSKLTTAVASPLATLATSFCPRRLELFDLRLAQKRCYEATLSECDFWHPEDERRFEACMRHVESACTVGNTQEGW